MRRALLRLSCLLAAAAAVRDAEDDMDRQLQMFASRYMFATVCVCVCVSRPTARSRKAWIASPAGRLLKSK